MENHKPPTNINALANAVKALGLHHEFACRVLAVLQEQERTMYALREDMKIYRAMATSADRISRDCLLKLADLNRYIKSK